MIGYEEKTITSSKRLEQLKKEIIVLIKPHIGA
jgi:hypothetical protein